ncbi:hypothetical protein B0T17DRAFT_6003 [Bombardia bombarda]|uniref:Uncharacterized protein n=1 Tax=Bombardia bombarda TaxID=252184 RepID=A0AA39XIR7_9PEZI|nr:hypothetical protein B0T17DRAFT_6003 [Bombardia bombarda]
MTLDYWTHSTAGRMYIHKQSVRGSQPAGSIPKFSRRLLLFPGQFLRPSLPLTPTVNRPLAVARMGLIVHPCRESRLCCNSPATYTTTGRGRSRWVVLMGSYSAQPTRSPLIGEKISLTAHILACVSACYRQGRRIRHAVHRSRFRTPKIHSLRQAGVGAAVPFDIVSETPSVSHQRTHPCDLESHTVDPGGLKVVTIHDGGMRHQCG